MTAGSPSTSTLSILLIEDNAGDATLIKKYVKSEFPKANLMLADSLEAATKHFEPPSLSLILCDLGLPRLSGPSTVTAVTEKMREFNVESPILVLTGESDDEVGFACVRLGASHFVCKRELTASVFHRAVLFALSADKS